jgi:hypothetical protein
MGRGTALVLATLVIVSGSGFAAEPAPQTFVYRTIEDADPALISLDLYPAPATSAGAAPILWALGKSPAIL